MDRSRPKFRPVDFCNAREPRTRGPPRTLTVGIGPVGADGADNSDVCIPTHAAIGRAVESQGAYCLLVVDSFEPAEICRKLNEFVSAITGPTWGRIVGHLRRVGHWEYEGTGEAP
ncbi:Imm8 family immunity protein [Frigoriglobus tundricola]|uniref:Imm8 family immunity protein n=1 Tax=Frigoriglobus tundricola TaxID=2774151 RepID=UPI00148EC8AA